MTDGRQLIFGVCLAMIVAGLVRLLMPSGSFFRSAGTITAFMMVASVIALLGGAGKTELDFQTAISDFEPVYPYTRQAEEIMEQTVVDQTKAYVEQKAKEQGIEITVQQVEVTWEKQQMVVETIGIAGSGPIQQLEHFAQTLSKELAIPVTIERITNEP